LEEVIALASLSTKSENLITSDAGLTFRENGRKIDTNPKKKSRVSEFKYFSGDELDFVLNETNQLMAPWARTTAF